MRLKNILRKLERKLNSLHIGKTDRPDRRNDVLEKYLRVRTDENQYYPQMPVRIHVWGKNLRRSVCMPLNSGEIRNREKS